MSENNFTNTVESLFKGMDAFITTKTVVGDAVRKAKYYKCFSP